MSIEGTAFPVVACYQRATSASEKKKDRSSVLDLIVGISSRRENRRRPRKGRVCVCVCIRHRCMEHATTIQFEALRPEACDNITATRYVLGVCTPLSLSVFPSGREEEDG